MDHTDRRADQTSRVEARAYEDTGLVTAATVLQPGQKLRVIKFVAYGWSAEPVAERGQGPGVGGG